MATYIAYTTVGQCEWRGGQVLQCLLLVYLIEINAYASADGELTRATGQVFQHPASLRRPGNSEARSEILKACTVPRVCTAIVTREHQTHRCRGVDNRLLPRSEAIDCPAVIEMVRGRLVDLPANAIVDCEVGSCLPRILRVGVKLLRARIDEAPAALAVGVGNSQQEVCTGIARGKRTAATKGEVAVILIGEWIGNMKAAPIKPELQRVPSDDAAKIVVRLIDLIDTRLRPVVAESDGEKTS